MRKNSGLYDGYYASWIRQRYCDEPQLVLQQLYDLQTFRSTRHRAGHQWPICGPFVAVLPVKD
jgi:hypothetical protein